MNDRFYAITYQTKNHHGVTVLIRADTLQKALQYIYTAHNFIKVWHIISMIQPWSYTPIIVLE